MKRPTSTAIVAFLFLVLLLLGGSGRKEKEGTGEVNVTFWPSFTTTTIPAPNELVRPFENEHPSTSTEAHYVPTGDALFQKLATRVQSRTGPDISWVHTDFLSKLVEAEAICPLQRFAKAGETLIRDQVADFLPPLLQVASWQRKLNAPPLEATSPAFLDNRWFFALAGFDPAHPPASWGALYEHAEQLTIERNADGKSEQCGVRVPISPTSGDLNIWMMPQWRPFMWQAGACEAGIEEERVFYNRQGGV